MHGPHPHIVFCARGGDKFENLCYKKLDVKNTPFSIQLKNDPF